jgi:hypothetical protein
VFDVPSLKVAEVSGVSRPRSRSDMTSLRTTGWKGGILVAVFAGKVRLAVEIDG